MLSLLISLAALGRAFWSGFRDPEFRALFVVFSALIAMGTIFYMRFEGWSFVDAMYFCVVTLATVGYGDLHPQTRGGKIFTIVFLLIGVGVFVGLAARLVTEVRDALNVDKTLERMRRKTGAERKERDGAPPD
jgi:voltage-gated potassium channel